MNKLFLFLFLISCSSTNANYNTNNKVFNFNEDLTFDEFNELLTEYAKTNPYPNIDQ
tara:strand:- start:402 stop:572 length:171 start_codon:yes stop_codon:yes gene_type:complete